MQTADRVIAALEDLTLATDNLIAAKGRADDLVRKVKYAIQHMTDIYPWVSRMIEEEQDKCVNAVFDARIAIAEYKAKNHAHMEKFAAACGSDL